MSEQERVRIEVAFDGGQILGGFASAASVEQLEKGLAAGEGAVTMALDDGEVTVAIKRVVYFKRFARETRVGFGS